MYLAYRYIYAAQYYETRSQGSLGAPACLRIASLLLLALVALFFRGGLRRSLLPNKRKEELKLGERLFRHGGELDSLWFTGHPLVVVLAAAYVVHMDLVLVNVDAPDYSLPVSPARTDITHRD